ncbi:MAG: DUF5674 family protein [Candidatus Paceibacterota bacterium]|jgi:hypothetical protein
MKIVVVKDSIGIREVKELAKEFYVSMIKGVVDVENEILALGGEYHMDANIRLLEDGFEQQDIWGFNIRLDKDPADWIEYVSLINIRPAQGNFDMEIGDVSLRGKIKDILSARIKL